MGGAAGGAVVCVSACVHLRTLVQTFVQAVTSLYSAPTTSPTALPTSTELPHSRLSLMVTDPTSSPSDDDSLCYKSTHVNVFRVEKKIALTKFYRISTKMQTDLPNLRLPQRLFGVKSSQNVLCGMPVRGIKSA